ncbi:hypothetical protein EJ110_NYTH25945 [Nymphaea thermarum]|nr:hypothetical protein EJ110_NYTH25945 [Nymphaea thermarum]
MLLKDHVIGAEVRADLKAIRAHFVSISSIPEISLQKLLSNSIFPIDQTTPRGKRPECASYVQVMLNFKGFLAIQSHQVAHQLRTTAQVPFAVDIHPGAQVGKRVLLDHATETVIGQTAVNGDHVSILHNVTVRGTRHPKLGNGVLVGAGTHVLRNIKIGDGGKIGAGSIQSC